MISQSLKLFWGAISLMLFSSLSVYAHASYYLQLGVFKAEDNAKKIYEKVQSKIDNVSMETVTKNGKRLFYVQAGPFETLANVKGAKLLASEENVSSFIISRKSVNIKPTQTKVKQTVNSDPEESVEWKEGFPPTAQAKEQTSSSKSQYDASETMVKRKDKEQRKRTRKRSVSKIARFKNPFW